MEVINIRRGSKNSITTYFVANGFLYRRHQLCQNKPKLQNMLNKHETYVRCVIKDRVGSTCKATGRAAITVTNGVPSAMQDFTLLREHNHEPNEGDIQDLRLRKTCYYRSSQETLHCHKIFNAEKKKYPSSTLEYSAIRRGMERYRKWSEPKNMNSMPTSQLTTPTVIVSDDPPDSPGTSMINYIPCKLEKAKVYKASNECLMESDPLMLSDSEDHGTTNELRNDNDVEDMGKQDLYFHHPMDNNEIEDENMFIRVPVSSSFPTLTSSDDQVSIPENNAFDEIIKCLGEVKETQSLCANIDATDYMFLGLSKIVKTFSPRKQADVKMKITQIVFNENVLKSEEL